MKEMTEEQKHTAVGQMAGMVYQVYYFLRTLLTLEAGQYASLELYDDVAESSNNGIRYCQLKHSIRKGIRISERDHDLWKTLAMWVSFIQSKGDENTQMQFIMESEYLLLTNKETYDNNFVLLLNEFRADVNNDTKWNNLLVFITSQASKKKSDEGQSEVSKYAHAISKFKLNREFLAKVIIEEKSDDDILNDIDKILEISKYVRKNSVPVLREILLGKLVESFNETIQKGKASIYSAELFNKKFGYIFDDCRNRKFVHSNLSFQLPKEVDNLTFIKQLKDISDFKVMTRKAVVLSDYLEFSNDYNLSKSGLSPDEIVWFEKDVHNCWDTLFYEVYDEPNDIDEQEMNKKGRELLQKIRKENVLFNGDNIGITSSNGCYYYFSNGEHPTIGWRQDWKEKYNGKEWTEIYGYKTEQ